MAKQEKVTWSTPMPNVLSWEKRNRVKVELFEEKLKELQEEVDDINELIYLSVVMVDIAYNIIWDANDRLKKLSLPMNGNCKKKFVAVKSALMQLEKACMNTGSDMISKAATKEDDDLFFGLSDSIGTVFKRFFDCLIYEDNIIHLWKAMKKLKSENVIDWAEDKAAVQNIEKTEECYDKNHQNKEEQ